MKLTPEDKLLLKNWGNSDIDIEQISDAIRCTTYTVYTGDSRRGRKISADTAVKMLGRREFLSGITRSAFHFTAVRTTNSGKQIYFNSRKLFE